MSASLDLQTALRARLTGTPAFTAIIPGDNVLDRGGRPERFPCLIIGEGQEIAEDLTLDRQHVRVILDLHAWAREIGIVAVKQAADAIRASVIEWAPTLPAHRVVNLRHTASRYMRDPDGEHSHAIVTIEALLREARP